MVVLIPAYQPDEKLITLIGQLSHYRVVVVDDGSGPAYATLFSRARLEGAEVITLGENRGKGRALKTGFEHIQAHFPGEDVVCADSDGQHTPEDIDAVAQRLASTNAAMVLGTRRFTGRVPVRSRCGNAITRQVYRAATGLDLADTQTGLRGYPSAMLAWLCQVTGERFEYELRLLLQASREGIRIEEVDIATVYLDGNASSHFRPVRDSLRIYGPLLAFTASSLLAFAIDTAALLALTTITGSVAASAVGARLISATTNYGVNRVWVFGSRRGVASRRVSAPRYAALAVGLLGANIALLEVLTQVIGSLLVAKIVTELSLFLCSYAVQRYLVFVPKVPGAGREDRHQPAQRVLGGDPNVVLKKYSIGLVRNR